MSYIILMKRWDKLILESKTPEEYVDRSFRSGLSPAEKARLARLWMEATGYDKEDILHARNRHRTGRKRNRKVRKAERGDGWTSTIIPGLRPSSGPRNCSQNSWT